MRYHPGPFQYSEAEMRWRIAKLKLALWRSKGVDIVVAHTPPKDLGAMPDPAHRGFQLFKDLIEQYHPAVFLHGHVHLRYNIGLPRERNYQGTRLINASERYVLEIPDRAVPQTEKNRLIGKTRHLEKI